MYFYRLQIYCSYEACSSLFEFCVKACILERLVGVKGATTFTNHRQNFLRQNPIIENLSYKTTSYISHKWRYLNQWKVPAILLFYKKINSATWKEQKN